MQKDLIAFAELSEEQLKSKIKTCLNDRYGSDKKTTAQSMPICDPDAEIFSLSLTIPLWVNLIERVRETLTSQITEKAADEIFENLE